MAPRDEKDRPAASKDRVPATPNDRLKEIEKAIQGKRERIKQLDRQIEALGDNRERWIREDRSIDRLEREGLRAPWLVLTEARRAAAQADVDEREFCAMALTVLAKETGIPQRAVYGCDHGSDVRGRPPYCGDEVTARNGESFCRWVLEDPFDAGPGHDSRMNGMHWTQTTYFDKIERVLGLKGKIGPPHQARPHLRVCLGDLAILRSDGSVREAFRRYNGSGPWAEAYATDATSNDKFRLAYWTRVLSRVE